MDNTKNETLNNIVSLHIGNIYQEQQKMFDEIAGRLDDYNKEKLLKIIDQEQGRLYNLQESIKNCLY